MLFKKIGSGKYLKKIDSVEYFEKGDALILIDGNMIAQYDDGSGLWLASPDEIVEADEHEVEKMFPMADGSRWYKWKEH